MNKIISGIYWVIGLINLIAHLGEWSVLNQYSKPLLMPVLLYLLYCQAQGHINLARLLLAVAIIFSWAGDVALLFDGDLFFMLGLGAFLVAHIFYIIAMNKAVFRPLKFQIKYLWPLFLFGGILMFFIIPKTGNLVIPVCLYATCLLFMMGAAILRREKTDRDSYQWTFLGALLFVISDSLLAVDRFAMPFDTADFLVMLTYIPAQYFIVRGILRHPG